MAKQEKRSSQTNRISFGTHEVRPVTKKDSWCYKPALSNGKPTKPEDWGYIITLPKLPKDDRVLLGINGHIVRTKKSQKQFLLQVIPYSSENPMYGISSTSIHTPRGGKKKKSKSRRSRILNVRNLCKTDSPTILSAKS